MFAINAKSEDSAAEMRRDVAARVNAHMAMLDFQSGHVGRAMRMAFQEGGRGLSTDWAIMDALRELDSMESRIMDAIAMLKAVQP